MSSWLDKENTIARPGFNRWLVPPAALAIHLSIGMAYGFSVFWLPLSRAIGVSAPIACPADMTFITRVFAANCDWPISMLGWTFTLFFVFLGSATALLGNWLERSGPRKAGVVAALCWSGGLVLSAAGVYLHQIWLLWLGAGVIGGIGLGLGYLSPIALLIKWFPDRRGMATGMAIMGFGGGAMVGVPLANRLMNVFSSPAGVGVWQTFLVLAAAYLIAMLAGALGYRLPATGWQPKGWNPATKGQKRSLLSARSVGVSQAVRTQQFWLVWIMIFVNISAGIGLLGMASPLLQEVFGGHLIGNALPFAELSGDQKLQIAAVAAGFVGYLSIFNIAGRFAWASLSDAIGRKFTYAIFFGLGILLYGSLPALGSALHLAGFAVAFGIIISMYGGGFATLPAYLADLFGTKMVGQIQGRMLTAWASAGVLGPVLINYIREGQLAIGVAPAQAYSTTMYILAGLLAIGLVCNLLVRPVAGKYFLQDEAPTQKETSEKNYTVAREPQIEGSRKSSRLAVVGAWAAVGIPMAVGLWITLQQALQLFK